MLTRRCTQRLLLLRPDPLTNQSFIYCLAVAAAKFGIHVHAVMVMSNHYHLIITDVRGNYPEFLGYLNSLLARCLNQHRGRSENFWASEQPGVLHLVDAAAVFDKTGYTLGNPVAAHLVDRTTNWPGVSSLPAQLGDRRMVAQRPHRFFRKDGDMPETAELQIVQPPQFENLTPHAWLERVLADVSRREESAAAERTRENRSVLGRRAVRLQSPDSVPKSLEARRKLTPRVATKNRWLRIERLQADKVFQQRYREARRAWTAGADARFPWGTYQLRLHARVPCDPDPAQQTC